MIRKVMNNERRNAVNKYIDKKDNLIIRRTSVSDIKRVET